jgi:electron transport complex protein RnfD
MHNQKLFISSHAPFWHNGSSISSRSCDVILAALPAVVFGICQYGASALGVVAFSISCAMLWELLLNKAMKRPVSIGDGNAAVIGLLFAMLLPASAPWWTVVIGTFLAIVVGKQIYGGLGCNPFNPVLVAFAIVMLSWKGIVNFDEALVNYDLGFLMVYPLGAVKHLGASAALNYDFCDLLMGRQSGGIGSTFGLGLILGGIYLILRGSIRWEIALSFLLGVVVTAHLFHLSDPDRYAGALFHLLTGYTLIGAFFLATEDSSSPVNFIPMLIYGACGGVLTVLVRSIGSFVDGAVFAILMMNVANPLLDKIRPRAIGRV